MALKVRHTHRRDVLWKGGGRRATHGRPPLLTWGVPIMFIQRFYDYDDRRYKRGYYFNFFGIVRILKFKVNTIMQKDDEILIIEVLGKEYVIH